MFSLNYGKQTTLNNVLSVCMCVLKPPNNLEEKFFDPLILAKSYTLGLSLM